MFGYAEPTYRVDGYHRLVDSEGQITECELRVPTGAGQNRYIALFAPGHDDRSPCDRLLLYGEDRTCQADWRRLTRGQIASWRALDWFEVVEGHLTGFLKSGGVTFY